MRVTLRRSPWLHPFPPPPPQLALCSAASSVLWAHPTSHRRRWQDYGYPSLPRPTYCFRAPMRSPSSCASDLPTCSVSPTAQDHARTRVCALSCVAFRMRRRRRHPGWVHIAAQWLACRPPVNASPHTSRCTTHDSGPEWFATPFLYWTFTNYHLPVCAGAPPVEPPVYARHGHELMGWKSPVGVLGMSGRTDKTTSRRQGQAREGMSEGSPSANVRGDGQKPHRRLSPWASQHLMTKPARNGG